jgi:O-antigen/teichoic acid export membrane protein
MTFNIKELISQSAKLNSILAVRVVNGILGFIIAGLLASLLGANEFGIYVLALTVVQISTIPMTLGLPNMLTRRIASAISSNRHDLVFGLLSFSFRSVIAMTIFVIFIGLITYDFTNQTSNNNLNSQYPFLPYLSALLVSVLALNARSMGILLGFDKPLHSRIPESIVRPLGLIIFVLTASIFFEVNAEIAIIAHILGALLAILIYMALLKFYSKKLLYVKKEYKIKLWIKELIPFSVVSGVTKLNRYTDILMLGYFIGAEAAGIYRVAVLFSSVMAMPISALGIVASPKFASAQDESGLKTIKNEVLSLNKLVLFAQLIIMAGLLILSPWALNIFFGETFEAAFSPIAILIIGTLLASVFSINEKALAMVGGVSSLSKLSLYSAILNIVLNILLIPFIGMLGAALALIISKIFIAVSSYYVMKKNYKYGINALNVAR